jgi:hypothetical protein
MPETRGLGAAGQLHLTWSVDWPKSPRTLASARGIEPTGATYIAVDCGANRPPGARLRFEAEWEEHAKMRWAALKLDDAGQNLGEVTLPGPDRGVGAQGTVAELEHVARVLLVGTNTGDPFRAFDPSDETPEPHGWQVSVASEIP